MFDETYIPSAEKWAGHLTEVWRDTRARWRQGRPAKPWLPWAEAEPDAAQDRAMPRRDRQALIESGDVVLGHFVRAFFPAYLPGRHTHHGSVGYAANGADAETILELARRVDALRTGDGPLPRGSEDIARALADHTSEFVRLELPPVLATAEGCYLANICIQRTRLPLGYLHGRLVPLLIAPAMTSWCCLLPLRFWSEPFRAIWSCGPPAYPRELLLEQCAKFNVEA